MKEEIDLRTLVDLLKVTTDGDLFEIQKIVDAYKNHSDLISVCEKGLARASFKGYQEIIEYYLSLGVKSTASDCIALRWAVYRKDLDAIKFILYLIPHAIKYDKKKWELSIWAYEHIFYDGVTLLLKSMKNIDRYINDNIENISMREAIKFTLPEQRKKIELWEKLNNLTNRKRT
jgi:hypothetical protein